MTSFRQDKLSSVDRDAVLSGMRSHMDTLVEGSETDWGDFFSQCNVVVYGKLQRIYKAGSPGGFIWFLQKGLVRNYYLTHEGSEFNKSFLDAPAFCGAMSEIIDGTPGAFSIETLEDSVMVAIPIAWLKKQCVDQPLLNKILLREMAKLASKKERREAQLLTSDASVRYQLFAAEHPNWIGRIPAYHIASYLGITDVALSRIKRKLRISKFSK